MDNMRELLEHLIAQIKVIPVFFIVKSKVCPFLLTTARPRGPSIIIQDILMFHPQNVDHHQNRRFLRLAIFF